ncbi:DUF937 domain-containing protein [Aurantiacibacter spongiae]|uniref:DUF937 domain-containing protein n=1 Tax=Aurantiacibacter spongiae TaxID=2488860 RepID=A0A3N5CT37_9SPHN|nr:DUF937 domain-containing protein [Aurantiacibacter spongiae]RPF72343.1 DUF937 domain-containing protein [Aurantiacibacter spongiae]
MNLSQMLQNQGVIASMANELNIDERTAQAGASALLPALVAGMGRQSATPAGLGGLGQILSGGGAGGGLLDAVLGRQPTPRQPGNDILGEIFGSKDVSRGVAEEAAGSTGISSAILKKMLPILAMAVMGYMMNQKTAQGDAPAGGGGLGGALGGPLGNILGQAVSGMGRR